jgi:Methylase involved in ubiquinone/menaquinone biosynthesis
MNRNVYDDAAFFEKYAGMERSRVGLAGAGEWETLKGMLPPLAGKRVLDLGCGYGWHCAYAALRGAAQVVGLDSSERMLEEARRRNGVPGIDYRLASIEETDFGECAFDVVLSSLALHYVADYEAVVQKVRRWLRPGGDFVFSAEHPVFTAQGPQQWHYDGNGRIDHFPVDRYFEEGARRAVFLGEEMTKYHRTLTTYVKALLQNGFALTGLVEPQPSGAMLRADPERKDELRRPMMLIVSARKAC